MILLVGKISNQGPGTNVRHVHIEGNGFTVVNCKRCGRFEFTKEAWEDYLDPNDGELKKMTQKCRIHLSHKIRKRSDGKPSKPPRVDTKLIEQFLATDCPGPSPIMQAKNLVRTIGEEIAETGQPFVQDDDLFVKIGAQSNDAVWRLFRHLENDGFVDNAGQVSRPNPTGGTIIQDSFDLTLKGWERFESEKRGTATGDTGFIALKFNDEVLDPLVNKAIKPAIKEQLNYNLVDMRDIAKAGIIDNIMRAQIRDSAFVIVDLTHDNSGAYWEAGYAEGLGKPVIYICEKTKFNEAQTHFDTNHCTTVIWDTEDTPHFIRELTATLRRSLDLFTDEYA